MFFCPPRFSCRPHPALWLTLPGSLTARCSVPIPAAPDRVQYTGLFYKKKETKQEQRDKNEHYCTFCPLCSFCPSAVIGVFLLWSCFPICCAAHAVNQISQLRCAPASLKSDALTPTAFWKFLRKVRTLVNPVSCAISSTVLSVPSSSSFA